MTGWSLGVLLGVTGCLSGVGPNDVVTVPGTATMRIGQQVHLGNGVWTLTFNAVTSDSRCPMGALCIVAGEAVLDLTLENLLSAQPRPPAYQVTIKGEVPDTIAGFIFQLKQLDPFPQLNKTIDPKEYVAKIAVQYLQYAPD